MVLEEPVYKNTKVYYRLFPNALQPVENIKILDDKKTIYIRCLQDLAKGRMKKEPSYWKFECDGVFFNQSQQKIYEEVLNDSLFDKVLCGGNAAIICFGQTYSGKSVTATALDSAFEDRGLTPRILEYIFNVKNELNHKSSMDIKMKYVETSRNYVVDLLSSDHVLYDVNSLKKISVVPLKNLQEALKLIFKAEARKTFKPTKYYNSNMANSVITLIITTKSLSNNYCTVGKLCIVDLCGADTIGNESCIHKNGLEVGNGNLIKTQLDQFAMILNTNNTLYAKLSHRICIVINYLNDILKSPDTLRFIGHLRLREDDLRITISMLRFGDCVRCLCPVKANNQIFTLNEKDQIKILKDNLLELKQERDFNLMLSNANTGETLSQDRYDYVQKLAQDYLDDKSGELVILTTTDAVLAMKVFKEAYNKIVTVRNNLAQEIKKQDELVRINKAGETTSSKHSKRSNASTASLKKINSHLKHNKRKSSSKIRDLGTEANTFRSKRTSKQNSNRRFSKRQNNSDAPVPSKKSSSTLLADLPDGDIPSYEIAWDKFVGTEEYLTLNHEYEVIGEQAKHMYENYLEDIRSMKKIADVLTIRKEELFKASLLKDLEETSTSKTELELFCENHVKTTEQELVQSKELLLKTQTELKLSMQERNILKKQLEQAFEAFCKQQFNTLIGIPMENYEKFEELQINSQLFDMEMKNQENSEEAKQAEEVELCKRIMEYNKLHQVFVKEYKRQLREKEKKRKWIQSCKLIY